MQEFCELEDPSPHSPSRHDAPSTHGIPERFFDVDDERVLVFVHGTAQGEGSGAPVELRDAHVLTIRNGICVRVKV